MKPLSQRERILVSILPTAILLVIYTFFLARPHGEELQRFSSQVSAARERVPSFQEERDVLGELQALEDEVKEKREAARERQRREEALLAFWNDPDAKARGGEVIGNLLASYGAVLVEEAVADEEDREDFAVLLEALPSAVLWRLRLAGNYDAIRRTVATISETELPIVPAGIEMEPRVEGNRTVHIWNLWICR